MYQALYRKYRPSVFDDVYGQDHITSVLRTQLIKNKISHAYLFCGSRGTGKTTCAKILAKAVNCEHPVNGEPCNECDSCKAINEGTCLDVVEMDAASNTGVDNIRRICDEVQFLPSQLKKRVYIIDEVHMLSIGAFNALLKTIEEPPEHVLFVLATTEMNSIPATIVSRCQRFDFKRLRSEVIIENLMRISGIEKIHLDRSAASVIAKMSDGAMRDALSLLEACQGTEGDIDEQKVISLLGLTSRKSIISLCDAIVKNDTFTALNLVDSLYQKMSDFKEIIGSLISLYRDIMIIKTVPEPSRFIDSYDNEFDELAAIAESASLEILNYQSELLQNFYSVYDRISSQKKASCEILFIKLTNPVLVDSDSSLIARIAELEKGKIASAPIISSNKENVSENHKAKEEKKAKQKSADISSENAISADNSEYGGSLKLKTLLQSDPFIKPWLAQISFEKKENSIIVLTGAFVKGMLISCGAEDVILSKAKEIDPDIASVVFEEKINNAPRNANTDDLEGL